MFILGFLIGLLGGVTLAFMVFGAESMMDDGDDDE